MLYAKLKDKLAAEARHRALDEAIRELDGMAEYAPHFRTIEACIDRLRTLRDRDQEPRT